jgi:hypothetical protein
VVGMGSYGPENGALLALVLPWPLSLSFLPYFPALLIPLPRRHQVLPKRQCVYQTKRYHIFIFIAVRITSHVFMYYLLLSKR